MEREVKLSAANYCYKTEYTDVYHVGKSKIHIFSSLEGFITEEDCFKLSKVETSRILLPTPVYQNGRYVGCRTKWQEKDWIYAFYNSGMSLKRNLIEMKEELELLSMLGYDIVDTQGFPFDKVAASIKGKGSCVVPVNLAENVKQLHEYLFNNYEYEPSEEVQAISDQITSDTGY